MQAHGWPGNIATKSPRSCRVQATTTRDALGMLIRRLFPLALCSGLAVALLFARMAFTGSTLFFVLGWNVFLAWVPLGLALCLERASRPGVRLGPDQAGRDRLLEPQSAGDD